MKGLANVPQLVSAIALWNSQLPARIAGFKSSNRAANVTLVDVQPAWHAILSNPKRHGAPDADCANLDGKSCLWHDDYHPGLAIHHAVAKTVGEALEESIFF
jgi:phospholipase/lecithinase/hemolysin